MVKNFLLEIKEFSKVLHELAFRLRRSRIEFFPAAAITTTTVLLAALVARSRSIDISDMQGRT